MRKIISILIASFVIAIGAYVILSYVEKPPMVFGSYDTIAYDATSNSGAINDVSDPYQITWNHTTSGTNRLLVVGLSHISSEAITGCTYNGTAMTLISTQTSDSGQISLFYLANPTISENAVLCTMGSIFTSGEGMAVSLTGVDQSSPLDDSEAKVSNGADVVSSTITSTVDKAWAVDAVNLAGGLWTLAVDTGQTARQNLSPSTAEFCGMSTKGAVTPAGNATLGWNDSGGAGSGDWAHVVGIFKPADLGGGTPTVSIESDLIFFE